MFQILRIYLSLKAVVFHVITLTVHYVKLCENVTM